MSYKFKQMQKVQSKAKDTTEPNAGSKNWTFGYPQCMNNKQSRLVCLHTKCEKYPFFCSSCQDQSCQNQHQHNDRITSIGFKQLIKKLITQRKPSPKLEQVIASYKNNLAQLMSNVTKFVQDQTKSVDNVLKRATQLEDEDQQVIKKLKQKQYKQIKGNQLDRIWNRVVPTQDDKKREKQMIQFLESKTVQVQELNKQFDSMTTVDQENQKHKQIQKQKQNNDKPKDKLQALNKK